MNPAPQSSSGEPQPPGTILLQKFMQPLSLTGYRVAKELSLAPITVSEILRGLRSISPTVACRLGRYFGVPATYWLTLQANYDAHIAANNGSADGVEMCDLLRNDKGLRQQLGLNMLLGLVHHDGKTRPSKLVGRVATSVRAGGNGALPKNDDQAGKSNGQSVLLTGGKPATPKTKHNTLAVGNKADPDAAPKDGMKGHRNGRS